MYNCHLSNVITLKLSRILRSVYRGIRLRSSLLRAYGVEIGTSGYLGHARKKQFFIDEKLF